MASFDTFGNDGDDNSYIGYDPRLPSQHYGSYSNFDADEETRVEDHPIDDESEDHPLPSSDYQDGFPKDDDVTVDHFSHTVDCFPISEEHYEPVPDDSILFTSMPESNGHRKTYDNGVGIGDLFTSDDGPVLPPPTEMHPEEGVVLRDWRRQNAMYLEEKEKREKEMVAQIIDEAEVYKRAFHEKREVNCQTNKVNNREREKLYLVDQENFYKNADKQYWKSISELIPHEVPSKEKKRGKKDSEKKPSIVVVQGPKPGKSTDLSRMRQLYLKLKHENPSHLTPAQPAPAKDKKDGTSAAAGETPNGAPNGSSEQEAFKALNNQPAADPEPIAAA